MTRLHGLWTSWGSSHRTIFRLGRILLYLVFGVLIFEAATLNFEWQQQAIVGLLTIFVGVALFRFSRSYSAAIMLIFASLLTTLRYAVWRITQAYDAIRNPSSDLHPTEIFFMLLLLAAEFYAFTILLLGYLQSIHPLRRPPVPMPPEVDEWPHVDVLIPTYNESLDVVRSTAFASINIDYPRDKLHVHLLDDGKRDEFRTFCEQIGIGYITRSDNMHAKAGNINRALEKMSAPLVAIFDCDHVPTRSFLQVTVGWFLKEKKLGMLQTPHHFYSPDPFERNLASYRSIPNEGELFYGLLQDGNDLWNATFFCGSCAVLRREALDEIGGIAVETVTEDAHTSLRMQTRGWNTAYINIPQAAGLATESLSAHIGQRIRWARGMIQILRIDNPLFVRGLNIWQRLCYFNAMVHFLYAAPRLIFLTAPLVYMLLGQRNIAGLWLAIAAYAMPHLVLSILANSRLQGKHRYSFWNEIYETVLAPYILAPTLLALVNPKFGKFNVTAKGGIVPRSYFDRITARPYRHLLLLNYIGLIVAPWRFFVQNADHKGAVLMNTAWILFNCVILGTANAVAVEAQQLRTNVRLERKLRLVLRTPKSTLVTGVLRDFSLGGGAMTLDRVAELEEAMSVEIIYALDDREVTLPAHVVSRKGLHLRFQYDALSLEQQELLVLVLYSRADSWISSEPHGVDRPLRSMMTILRLSFRGIRYSFTSFITRNPAAKISKGAETSILFLICFGLLSTVALGLEKSPTPAITVEPALHKTVSIADMGNPNGILLRGADSYVQTALVFTDMEVAQKGVLHLRYSFSPKMIPARSLLTVVFNGVTLTELPMPPPLGGKEILSADLPLPADLLSTHNTLQFQLHGHYEARCEDPSDSRLWARIDPRSMVEIDGTLIPIANDLARLPRPFYDPDATVSSTSIGVSFDGTPSKTVMRAAAAVSSWFGVQSNSHALVFPVSAGHLHPGNGIVFAQNSSPILSFQNIHAKGPSIAIEANPVDGVSKLLVVSGDTDEQILTAAHSLAMGETLHGENVSVVPRDLPPERQVDDSPRWVQTGKVSSLWSYTETSDLRSDGSQPIISYVRIPPDLFYGDHTTVPLRVNYQYKRAANTQGAFLRVTANGSQIAYLPLSSRGENGSLQSTIIPVPVENLRPFANTLQFDFIFPVARGNVCRPLPPVSSSGTLFRSSSLDLSDLPHWASMPNLELFANSGFPFTRHAYLSQTTVVLPPKPTDPEIETMLNMLAYFGAQTGLPALRVEIGNAESFNQDRELLVIGNEADMLTMPGLDAKLPLGFDQGGPTRQLATTLSLARRLWTRLSRMDPESISDLRGVEEESRLDRALQHSFDSVIQAVESPKYPGRSVVVVLLGQGQQGLFPAFLKVASSAQVHGNLSIQHGSEFASFDINPQVYYVGHITAFGRVRAWMHQEPWAGVLLPFLMGLLWAPWVEARLKARAAQRLRGDIAAA